MVLVGNKADMRDQRVVKEAEAQEIAKQLGTTSASVFWCADLSLSLRRSLHRNFGKDWHEYVSKLLSFGAPRLRFRQTLRQRSPPSSSN